MMNVQKVDLSSGRSFMDGFPQDFFTWLRRNEPLYWHDPTPETPDGEGFWVISRYDDIVAILKDAATFSSEQGGTQLRTMNSANNGLTLNISDDPIHKRQRALVNQGFTPRNIARLEGDLRRRTREILDTVPVGETFNFVEVVARELPLQAICNILGVPQEDRAQLAEWVDEGTESDTGEVIGTEYVKLLGAYGLELIERKRREPKDDILSIVVHARLDDDTPQLNDRELRAFFTLLFPAGAETTRSAIAGGLLALIENPDQFARLRKNPDLLKTAIEEMLRWTSPSVYKRRTVTDDAVVRGQRIARGQKVTIWEMSANRDEEVFADPFRFDIARQPNPHIAFGYGIHFCLGASLARLEMKVMFEELLSRYQDFELAGEPRWTLNNRLVGLRDLPLRVMA